LRNVASRWFLLSEFCIRLQSVVRNCKKDTRTFTTFNSAAEDRVTPRAVACLYYFVCDRK